MSTRVCMVCDECGAVGSASETDGSVSKVVSIAVRRALLERGWIHLVTFHDDGSTTESDLCPKCAEKGDSEQTETGDPKNESGS